MYLGLLWKYNPLSHENLGAMNNQGASLSIPSALFLSQKKNPYKVRHLSIDNSGLYTHICTHMYTHICGDVHVYQRLLQEDYKCLVQCDNPPFTCKDAAVTLPPPHPPQPESKVFGFSKGGDGRGDSFILSTARNPSDS